VQQLWLGNLLGGLLSIAIGILPSCHKNTPIKILLKTGFRQARRKKIPEVQFWTSKVGTKTIFLVDCQENGL